MEKQLFIDLFNDIEFSGKITAMCKTIYRQNKRYFEDQAIDGEDFVQEMWCQLFEEKTFTPDKAWCFETMKHNAINYLKNLKNRDDIASMVSFEDLEDI
jgi:DNA-directed RNA polymerase specialized sigma24 family protein